ncbi:MAG TPA: hypothetical protein VFG24_07450, partial [Nitrosopumilaceae archaeon]|nr:hypothetical protein [Nitrosopumilaceae archaeon]
SMIQTAWFKYNPIECQNTPWVKEVLKSNNTYNMYDNWFNSTLIRKYLQNHEVTLLELRDKMYRTAGVPTCGTIADWATFYFLVPQNDTSKMTELGFKSTDEKEVQDSGASVINLTNLEQKIWFEFDPIQCQKTPWVNWSMNFSRVGTEAQWIKWYFKDQGITILDAKRLYSIVTSYTHIPNCGEPSLTDAYYFLVFKSDADKMSNLGYKILTTPMPLTTSRIQ